MPILISFEHGGIPVGLRGSKVKLDWAGGKRRWADSLFPSFRLSLHFTSANPERESNLAEKLVPNLAKQATISRKEDSGKTRRDIIL